MHISKLKLGKAADVYGVTAEHIKYAGPSLLQIVTFLTNKVYSTGILPQAFKTGALVPSLKKKKPAKLPDSHRRITIAGTVGKVTEKEMTIQTKPCSLKHQDPSQYGFTEKCSPSICSLMVTEAIAEAKDLDQNLYISLMDSAKAFDLVDHIILYNSLHSLNLSTHLLRLYGNMYQGVQTRVRLN